jgi:YhcH/YjgK/YiaL family protein
MEFVIAFLESFLSDDGMIFDTIEDGSTDNFLKNCSVLQEALGWIRNLGQDPEEGTHYLRGDDMYGMIQSYETKDRSDRLWESHRKYVDLQYCISGGEIIDWEKIENLTPDGEFMEDKDATLYQKTEAPSVSLIMQPGRYALLFPEDGHRPGVVDGVNAGTKKVVVKIALNLLLGD